jgi:predicted membrane metal-binding protein
MVITCLFRFTQNKYNGISIALLYCTGILTISSSAYRYRHYGFEHFHHTLPRQPCKIRGIVQAIEPAEHLRTPERITLEIKEIYIKNSWKHRRSSNATIFIYTQRNDTIRVGDTITLPLITIKKPINKKFTHYLLKEGIYAVAFAPTRTDINSYRPLWSLWRYIAEKRAALFTQLRTKLKAPTFALYSALFLGNRSFNKKETEPLNTRFKRWGIAHIYARSGMHLGLIVLVWFAFMRSVPLPYYAKHSIVVLMSLLYTLLSWSSISFIRSLILFLLYQACRIIKESYSIFYLTALVCTITLLVNPLRIFFKNELADLIGR